MKNTVKKVLCTFIAVVAAVTSTLVFTGCGSKKATSDVSIPDYTFSESSKEEESSQAEESSKDDESSEEESSKEEESQKDEESSKEEDNDSDTVDADWGKKIDDIDEDSLSKADYDYYIDVTTRVTKKLAEVAE